MMATIEQSFDIPPLTLESDKQMTTQPVSEMTRRDREASSRWELWGSMFTVVGEDALAGACQACADLYKTPPTPDRQIKADELVSVFSKAFDAAVADGRDLLGELKFACPIEYAQCGSAEPM